EWVHVQLHQQKGMISLSPPTICNSAARGIWVYHKGNTIIMLRVFIKKSQKTPAKEIDLAKKRLAEVLNETGKP
ncbi:type II toxin-antitoxin system RelE/ParE family toxin, partial [Klebsiella pneumoniae]|nr:type II toxin-antitoxin system RelE/ParE family toxin [Klebsiella pneumoniae]